MFPHPSPLLQSHSRGEEGAWALRFGAQYHHTTMSPCGGAGQGEAWRAVRSTHRNKRLPRDRETGPRRHPVNSLQPEPFLKRCDAGRKTQRAADHQDTVPAEDSFSTYLGLSVSVQPAGGSSQHTSSWEIHWGHFER